MNEIGHRLREALKLRHYSQLELARTIQMVPSAISQIVSGARNPSDRTIRDICAALHISEEWLRTGDGEMDAPPTDAEDFIETFKPTPAELRLFQIFNALPDESKEVMLDMIRTMGTALEEIRAAEQPREAEPPRKAPPATVKPKGDPVPPPAGPNILDEYDDIEFDYLDTAAAHDVDGVSPYPVEADDDFNPA